MNNSPDKKYFDRELSWLSFNHRVLQEAASESVPLYERIKFLAIYSSNLDEFFRVRVASLRSLLTLKKKSRKKLSLDPEKLLKKIHNIVYEQQEKFGGIFNRSIVPALAGTGIYLVNEESIPEQYKTRVSEYFKEHLLHNLQPVILERKKISAFLQNRHIYFAIRLAFKKEGDKKSSRHKYALVEIPSDKVKRFYVLNPGEEKKYIILLDDIIRENIHSLFPGYYVEEIYSIKLTRDAELYIDDEFSGNLLEKIKKSLSKRSTGVPSRFLFDKLMANDFLNFLSDTLSLSKDDLVPGGRYHNFHDFFSFPPSDKKDNYYETHQPITYSVPSNSNSFFEIIQSKDVLLHYPYQSYEYVINFLNEAANDSKVKSISITLYRIASGSKIAEALITASGNGKKVTAFVEVKARFDEEANLSWAEELARKGVDVHYSFPGMKVHSKVCLIEREEETGIKLYAYLSTGNFNEKTALIYADLGLFTSDTRITDECRKVFNYLTRESGQENFEHLLAAPFNLRTGLEELVNNEIKNSFAGKKASIILKLNSLEDKKIIKKLYEASQAGVRINIIVRGICCLVPGVKGQSENIKVISIVDRYLEHSRIYIFHNDGKPKYYFASADLMGRNLNRRVELCVPVYDPEIQKVLKELINLQLKDNLKARIVDKKQTNNFKKSTSQKRIRAQYDTYEYMKTLNPFS